MAYRTILRMGDRCLMTLADLVSWFATAELSQLVEDMCDTMA